MRVLDHDLTLILIKSDMEERKLTSMLLNKLKNNGLEILYQGLVQFNLEIVRLFYQWDVVIHPREIGEYLCTRPMTFLIVRGDGAISKTCVIKQELRKALSDNNPVLNLMHCSDSPEEFKHEYAFIFKQQAQKEKKIMSEIKN